MDPAPLPVDQDRDARIEAILERARRLSANELRRLVATSRGDGGIGFEDRRQVERRRRRLRAVMIAVSRSRASARAAAVQAEAVAAVRSAAAQARVPAAFGRLGTLFDAELAVADAALAVLLEDRLGAEVVALLNEPWLRAIGRPAPSAALVREVPR